MTDDYKEGDNKFTGKIQQGDDRVEVMVRQLEVTARPLSPCLPTRATER